MTRVTLLETLQDFTQAQTGNILLPVKPQKGDTKNMRRAAEVHLMRLPDGSSVTRRAPYILHQLVTAKDKLTPGEREPDNTGVVRSVFCIYHEEEREGALQLLNLLETVRIGLLERPILRKQFILDMKAGLEWMIYPEDFSPYYIGEMVSTWHLPPVKRKDCTKCL